MDVLIYAPQKYFNFAAIVRTLDFFGLHKVYIVDANDLMQPFEECSKSWQRKLKNVSSGSIKHVQVEKVDDSFILQHKGRSIATYAETAKERQQRIEKGLKSFNDKLFDLDHFRFEQDDLLIFGSEATGVPETILEAADCCLSLPTRGAVDSLNLGVCVGVFVREAIRHGAFAREHATPRVFRRRGGIPQDSSSESPDSSIADISIISTSSAGGAEGGKKDVSSADILTASASSETPAKNTSTSGTSNASTSSETPATTAKHTTAGAQDHENLASR